MDIEVKFSESRRLYYAKISDGSRYGRKIYGATQTIKFNRDEIKEIDTVIEQIISKTEKDKAEKLKKAYEVVKKDYQDKINLSVIRTDHSLYL